MFFYSMGLLWFLAISMLYLLLLYSLFTFTITNCFPSVQPALCHDGESSALLQFKQSFVIAKFASESSLSYPKTVSWKQSTDCCSWDGVECDEQTGHVIGLDLSSSQFYGSIESNSTLFQLLQLQRLNLSDNHFNYSQIPSTLAHLSRLTHLDLSWSKFSGEIPDEISQLSKLLDLGLCCNYVPSNPLIYLLQLKQQNFRNIIQNLTNLEVFDLNFVIVSSPIPDRLTNLSSLKSLALYSTGVYGEFPIGIFHLPHLKFLDVGFNQDLTGYLPSSIGNLNALQVLAMGYCNFSGSIPSSLSNLTQLTFLDLGSNHFKGNLTSSLSNLTQLGCLSVGGNDITSVDISWIGKLNRLYYLGLSTLNIGSEIPNSFANLTQLSSLVISYANLIGQIPSWIMNYTNLESLDLLGNKLHGEIPHSIFLLENLSLLFLRRNLLGGQLELDKILNLKRLTDLDLSYNNLSMLTKTSSFNASLPRNIISFQLASCNINEFPKLLKYQDQLEILELSHNKIHDNLPSWMWRKQNLWALALSNNLLIGEIPSLICNLKSLKILDLSFNNLSGTMPPCLGASSKNTLKPENNKLFGFIPQTFMKANTLQLIHLSQNNLQGQLPKALVNCKMLEYLDVSNNHINGSFPFWLGTLPELKVLVLRSNKFSGVISSPRTSTFPKLHIIDLSQNDFSGNLPLELIQNWESMKTSNLSKLKYEVWYYYYKETGSIGSIEYHFSFTIFNKGNLMEYENLQEFFFLIIIDFSSNKLDGEISDAIGDLKGLVSLNLSNNLFTGGIPSSLGKLSQLQGLDLSHNSLSGRIPQELTQLTFLEFLNVSSNYLSGPIPQSTQFDTFESSSFEGNQGLCGKQLLKKCEDHVAPPSATDEVEDSWSPFEFDWKIVLLGYGCGLVIGLSLGSTLSLEKHALLWLKRAHIRVQRR